MARVVAHRFAGDAGSLIESGYADTRDDGSRTIFYSSGDRPDGLRKHRARRHGDQGGEQHRSSTRSLHRSLLLGHECAEYTAITSVVLVYARKKGATYV